jgi:adenosine deaminase
MVTREWCQALPKVELHVHFEGSVRPETVLALAKRHDMPLPADTVEGLQEWYRFRDFRHFVEIYVAITQRIKTADDLMLVGQQFVDGQVAQNVVHSEVTYTAATIEKYNGIAWPDQLEALQSIQQYGRERGTSVQFIIDIVRGAHDEERAMQVTEWALEGHQAGVVCALGLAGEEWRGTKLYHEAVAAAESARLPFVPHAGETQGPEVIWDCLEIGHPKRIGHGVRCIEDPELVKVLREQGIVLEVCPTSNVALGVVPDLSSHQLPKLIQEGLRVTLNSDDPPMFNTTVTDELFRCATTFGLSEDDLTAMQQTARDAALLMSFN